MPQLGIFVVRPLSGQSKFKLNNLKILKVMGLGKTKGIHFIKFP